MHPRDVMAAGRPRAPYMWGLASRLLESPHMVSVSARTVPVPSSPRGDADLPQVLGGFRIVGPIAEGGMGVVLLARHVRAQRLVALKTVRSSRAIESAAIRREAAALRRLRHPGIVRLLADGVCGARPWIALELLEGRSLAQYTTSLWSGSAGPSAPNVAATVAFVTRDELVPGPARWRSPSAPAGSPVASAPRPPAAAGQLRDTLTMVVQICLALDYVHGRGLVHRDIKPGNVVVAATGRVTLLDFGLASPVPSAPTVDRKVYVGTVEYAAPEQIRGEAIDERADLYSLGCLLFELVTGRRPFEGETSHDIAEHQLESLPPPPSRFVSGVPWPLEDLLLTMLAKNRKDRPNSAGEVARRLATIARRAAPSAAVDKAQPQLGLHASR